LKNFFDTKEEKITEKAFSQSLLISVFSIFLCIVALCSITFAWFTSVETSNGNIISAGSFDLTISVSKDGNEFPVVADADKVGVWNCDLTEEGTYTVHLKLKEESSVKGHCIVKVGDGEDQHTDAIVNPSTVDFIFSINATANTKVAFEPRWGIVVEPDIQNGGAYPTVEAIAEEGSEQVSAEQTNDLP
jgi:predicted ribosomally synthesized peptide with SipW-like signal peptide